MALSYCPSFGSLNNQQDYSTQLYAPEDELLCFNDNFNYLSSDHFINPLLEFDESLFYLSKDPSHTPSLFPAELPKFEAPAAGFCEGRSDKKERGQGGRLSAQSIAARERRRKITDRTHELGKLVPGGNKMNTAEMLRSAFNYVKFLQAQVKLLQVIHQCGNPNRFDTDELHNLVASPKVQEKLYSEEKCLVPMELISSVTNHDEIQPNDPFFGWNQQLLT